MKCVTFAYEESKRFEAHKVGKLSFLTFSVILACEVKNDREVKDFLTMSNSDKEDIISENKENKWRKNEGGDHVNVFF